MPDDKRKRGKADRSRGATKEPYEVNYFARKYGIPKAEALKIIKKAKGNRAKADQLAEGLKHHIPHYSCSCGWMDNAEPRCIAFGGLRVDDAIENALLTVVGPGRLRLPSLPRKRQASDEIRSAKPLDAISKRRVMRPTAPSGNTTRRTRPIDWSQANWRRWNKALAHVAEIVGKIAAHDVAAPAAPIDHASPGLASNLKTVWSAPTTDARLKKRIVRAVIQEVVADIDDAAAEIVLVVH